MKFKIDKEIDEEKIVKAIRFPKSMIENIEVLTNKNNITFSKFIILAVKYAIDNIEDK